MKTVLYVVQLALGIGLPLALQLWDWRRLTPWRRAHAWNTSTWWAALYAFGPASMLGWCWTSRRDMAAGLRLLLGVLSTIGVGAAVAGLSELAAMALGLSSAVGGAR